MLTFNLISSAKAPRDRAWFLCDTFSKAWKRSSVFYTGSTSMLLLASYGPGAHAEAALKTHVRFRAGMIKL